MDTISSKDLLHFVKKIKKIGLNYGQRKDCSFLLASTVKGKSIWLVCGWYVNINLLAMNMWFDGITISDYLTWVMYQMGLDCLLIYFVILTMFHHTLVLSPIELGCWICIIQGLTLLTVCIGYTYFFINYFPKQFAWELSLD